MIKINPKDLKRELDKNRDFIIEKTRYLTYSEQEINRLIHLWEKEILKRNWILSEEDIDKIDIPEIWKTKTSKERYSEYKDLIDFIKRFIYGNKKETR